MSDKPQCFDVDDLNATQIRALRSVYQGTADANQQRVALQIIVNNFCRTHDVLFIPGHADQTTFLNGRAYVGMQILKYIKVPIGKLAEETSPNE